MWPILAASLLAVNACATVGRPAPVSQAADWRAYLGSNTRAPRGAAGDSLPADPQVAWRRALPRGIAGAPALTEDVVAVSQVDRHVVLLDRATGTLLWSRGFASNLGSGPLVDYDRVYVATQTEFGEIAALALRDGKPLWKVRFGDAAAPLAQRTDRLFAATTDGSVAALSTTTGGRMWRRQLSGAVRAAPLVTVSGVFVATADDSLYLLDPASGDVRARRPTGGAVLAAPALADSLLVFGTAAGRLEACDTATLVARWSVETGGTVVGSVAVRADTVWAMTGDGQLWAVPVAAPAAARHVALGLVPRAGPTPVRGGVLVTSTDGTVALVDPATGERRWSAKLRPPVVEPALVGRGDLLAVSERGEVVLWR